MPETIMEHAFIAAGHLPPSERLDALAKEAWAKHPKDRTQCFWHVRAVLQTDLTWQLIDEYQPRTLTLAIEALLERARIAMIQAQTLSAGRDGRGKRGGDQKDRDAHSAPVPAAKQPPTGGMNGPGQRKVETHMPAAQPVPSLTQMADRQQERMASRMVTAVSLSKLDTFLINGQKLGDITPREANAWAASQSRNVTFIHALTAGLLPDKPIRQMLRPEEADDIYARIKDAA